MRNAIIHWLEQHMGTCYYRKYLGFDCLGCGMQRAFIELLKGNLWTSIQFYPALLPLIFTFGFLVLHLIFKFRFGAWVLKGSFILTILLVVVNFLYKLIAG
jgi:hypothetical protein